MYRLFLLFLFSNLFSAQIQIQNQVLTVEIASSEKSWAKGLMGREDLPEGTGMLFIYPNPRWLSFWMKNTVIPLSIGFFDKYKTLINTAEMEPINGTAQSAERAQYALEVPKGWFERHKIRPGAKFSFLDQENELK